MSDKEVFQSIKDTVCSYLPGARVLLFGSRARGDFNKNSDFDLLVVTSSPLASEEKMKLESRISKSLVYSLKAPFDVLLQSEQEVDQNRHAKASLTYYALKDAVEL